MEELQKRIVELERERLKLRLSLTIISELKSHGEFYSELLKLIQIAKEAL
jgi:hypothetical protein